MFQRWIAIVGLVAACGGSSSTGPAPMKHPAEPARTQELVGGKLFFRVIDGALPAILLEAGGGADSSSWKELPAQLARATGHRVAAYDRVGFGNIPLPAGPFTVEDEVELLHHSLGALGITRGIVVAESYGGLIALELTRRHPAAVSGLVFLDPMNPGFVEAVGIDRVTGTAPKIESPKDDRERAIARMVGAFSSLVAGLHGQRWGDIPAIIVTAGIPWWPDESMRGPWRASHDELARTPRAKLWVAERSKHDIAGSQPELVVDAVKSVLAVQR